LIAREPHVGDGFSVKLVLPRPRRFLRRFWKAASEERRHTRRELYRKFRELVS